MSRKKRQMGGIPFPLPESAQAGIALGVIGLVAAAWMIAILVALRAAGKGGELLDDLPGKFGDTPRAGQGEP
jgi:hypothetical protein